MKNFGTIIRILILIFILIFDTCFISNSLQASSKEGSILLSKNTKKSRKNGRNINKYYKNKRARDSQKTSPFKNPIEYAKYLIDQRQTQQAFAVLVDFLNKNPFNKEAYYQMGRIYFLGNDYNNAHIYFQKAAPYIDPDSAYDYAIMYYNSKNYYQAVIGFQSVSQGSYLKDIANFYAGVCYLELGRILDAEKYFMRAEKLSPRYADLKQRYLNAIQIDKAGGINTGSMLYSRMALPPMNNIDPRYGVTGTGENAKIAEKDQSGFTVPKSLAIETGVGAVSQKNKYVDYIESTGLKVNYKLKLDGRLNPNYSQTLQNKRDLTISFPINLISEYNTVPPDRLSKEEKEAYQKASFIGKTVNTLGFEPNLGIPIQKSTTFGAKYKLALIMVGTNTNSLWFENFLGMDFRTSIGSTNFLAELGAIYNLSGVSVQKPVGGTQTQTQAKAVKGMKGGLKVNGGVDGFAYSASGEMQYNLQTKENLSDAVTNDMITTCKLGFTWNGEYWGADVEGVYEVKKDNKEATVEGSKTKQELNGKFRLGARVIALYLKGKFTRYPEYVYQNDDGYVTTTGNSSSVEGVLEFTPFGFIKIAGNVEYYTNDYGIDRDYAAMFYIMEKKHVLTRIKYGTSLNISFTF